MRLRFYIDKNGRDIEVNPSEVSLQDRIDEALGSGSFSFFSNQWNNNIPPYTECYIEDEDNADVTYRWLCSSVCSKVLENPNNLYFHQVTLYDPTKLLELYLVGTKSFSVVEGVEDYNTNYDRIEILLELMKEKYGKTIAKLPYEYKKRLTNVRSYSFGPGTTLYDAILKIAKDSHCLPRIKRQENSWGGNWVIDLVDFDEIAKQTEVKNFTNMSLLQSSQSVDDYCSQVETELSNVVDRNTPTTAYLTMRSESEEIKEDNICLKLPTKAESVNYISFQGYGVTGPTMWIPANLLIGTANNWKRRDTKMIISISDFSLYPLEYFSETTVNQIKRWINGQMPSCNYVLLTALLDERYETRGVFITLDESLDLYTTSYKKMWFKSKLLNEEQYALLSANARPKYIYYSNGSEYIKGFREFKDSSGWNKYIYGEKGPWLKEQYATDNFFSNLSHLQVINGGNTTNKDEYYYRPLVYDTFFDKLNDYGFVWADDNTKLYFAPSYNMIVDGGQNMDLQDMMFKVEYIPYVEIFAKEEKTHRPSNQNTWTTSARSYDQNGATIDFNTLVPSMERAVDMLGIPTKTIHSLDDYPVGTKTDQGYIITKEVGISTLKDGNKVYSEIYTTCENYEQIAQAIGIDTQYEATNVASTEIMTRHIILEKNLSTSVFENYDSYWLNIQSNNIDVVKLCSVLRQGDTAYLVCECEDNYAIDYTKEKSDKNYYKRTAITYSDDNQLLLDKVTFWLLSANLEDMDKEALDYYPLNKGDNDYNVVFRDSMNIYKDSREKLVITIKLNLT